jgi:hypothetical protein
MVGICRRKPFKKIKENLFGGRSFEKTIISNYFFLQLNQHFGHFSFPPNIPWHGQSHLPFLFFAISLL